MITYPLLFSFGFWEIVIIALVILLLFGGRKFPELMKGLGKGVKSFKEGVKGVENEVKELDTDAGVKGGPAKSGSVDADETPDKD